MFPGNSYMSQQFQFRVANNTVGKIVPETCKAIFRALATTGHFKCPTSEADWREVAEGYNDRWNFPNTLGSIDGKHVRVRQPAHSGSHFYNYKHFYSIVLMAVVDSRYR
jgi:hypothetical protein